MNSNVWIVVPAYNEGSRVGDTIDGLCAHCDNIVVVDDGSTDSTHQVALQHSVWLLRHSVNCGQGAALQTGIDFALGKGAEVIVTFDADGQHQAEDVSRLVDPVARGEMDVVLGSRFLGDAVNMPISRRIIIKLGVIFTRLVSRLSVTDTHNGIRAFSRKAAEVIRIRENRMAHASDILHQIRELDLRYGEVPVTVHYDLATLAKGQSNWNALRIAGRFMMGRLVR